ncbi:MAG: hypothetical protein ACTSRI_10555 [Promethearchaeota archaeon]
MNQGEIELSKLLKGIVICKESGEYLLDLILDSEIDPILLSSFVGALSLFGKNLEKIEEINIKGLDVDMIIIYKYNLIFVIIIDKGFRKYNFREEAEKSLDMFYSSYLNEIKEDCVDISKFEYFKKILYMQIKDYFEKISDLEKEKEIGDFGFFTQAIKKLRNSLD